MVIKPINYLPLLLLSIAASANNCPPVTLRDVSLKVKASIYVRDKVPQIPHCCEVDHIVPLSLSGTNQPDNLMIQSYTGPCNARHKDALENRLRAMVCKNLIPLSEAQATLRTNWEVGYNKYFGTCR